MKHTQILRFLNLKIFLIVSLSCLFLVGCTSTPVNKTQLPNSLEKTQPQPEENKKDNIENINTDQEEEISEPYKVLKVFDGDTIFVEINQTPEKVRLIGIDTPEVDGGYRTADCYGEDASKRTKELLAGQRVSLLKGEKTDDRDKFGRLLRYVFFNGKDIGSQLIEEGYATHYDRFDHDRKKYYEQLQQIAQDQKVGMWNEENCSYWGQEG